MRLTTVTAICAMSILLLPSPAAAESGIASWYGHPFHGRRTASGRVYNMNEPTCAHKTLRFGTIVRVTRVSDGRSTVCTVTDRGPFVAGRVIDLSHHGAAVLGLLASGVAQVRVEVLRQK